MFLRPFHSLFFIGFIFAAFPASSESLFKKQGTCGTAIVESGDSCSNIKVKFDFKGCELKSEPEFAKKIICEKDVVKARFQAEIFRYEARFQKIEDGWGGTSWKQISDVTEYKKNSVKTNPPAEVEVKVKVASTPALETPSPQPTQPIPPPILANFKFGAFADIRYTNFTTKDNPVVATGNPESGFNFEDGAFYGTYEKDRVAAYLDLSFRRSKDIDTDSAATKPNQSSNGNFAVGYDKSQAYVKYKMISDLSIYFGQFDTIFGFELNDSKDRAFSKAGIVYDYTLPATHTGTMLEYSKNGYYFKTFAANPNNKGSLGSSATNDDKTEYGAALGFSNDQFRSQLGFMSRTISKASGTEYDNRTLLDFLLGFTHGPFTLDLEYNLLSDPSKNTLTTSDNLDLEKAGQGFLALATYKINEEILFAVRHESLRNDPASSNFKSVDSLGGSLSYKLSDDLKLKAEYISYDSKNLSDYSWKDSRFIFAALLTL